ncbi:MAG TPA: YtoQ family protein [Phycisphaerae bacterium]|nr:YtoQ family protein [Phycisphaerae bacterium]
MPDKESLLVYLAGHIHGDWRERVRKMAEERGLPVRFRGPREDHARSDNVGFDVLGLTAGDVGEKLAKLVRDDLGGRANNLRTRLWIGKCVLVLAFFDGEQTSLRQWNTAADIGVARALGKPVLVVRTPNLVHSLKELTPRADFVVDSLEQAVDALAYVFEN